MIYVVMQLDKVGGNIKGVFFHRGFHNKMKAESYAEEVREHIANLNTNVQKPETVVYVQELQMSLD